MKFTVSSSAFYENLVLASKVLLSKNTFPILDCFMLDVKNGHVYITASDSEKHIVTKVPLIDADNNARFCVRAKLLIESTKEIADQPLTIDFNPETLEIVGLHETGQFTVMGESADTYPDVAPLDEQQKQTIEMSTSVMIKGVSQTVNAASNEELRKVMTSIYMDVKADHVVFVATDGRKLVRYINREVQPGFESGIIMQKKVALIAKSALKAGKALRVSFDSERACFVTDDIEFYFRKVEGNYLNYEPVIPESNPFRADVDRQSFLSAVKRVSVFTEPATGLTKLHMENGTIKLTAQDSNYRTDARETLLCGYDQQPISIGFNCFYVIELIQAVEAEAINIQLADPSRPALITPIEDNANEQTTILVMPLMLND